MSEPLGGDEDPRQPDEPPYTSGDLAAAGTASHGDTQALRGFFDRVRGAMRRRFGDLVLFHKIEDLIRAHARCVSELITERCRALTAGRMPRDLGRMEATPDDSIKRLTDMRDGLTAYSDRRQPDKADVVCQV